MPDHINMRQLIALRNFSSIPLAEVPALPADHPRSQNATRRRLTRLHAALCPEQQRANANLCFNGLELRNPADAREALSIREMIEYVVGEMPSRSSNSGPPCTLSPTRRM